MSGTPDSAAEGQEVTPLSEKPFREWVTPAGLTAPVISIVLAIGFPATILFLALDLYELALVSGGLVAASIALLLVVESLVGLTGYLLFTIGSAVAGWCGESE